MITAPKPGNDYLARLFEPKIAKLKSLIEADRARVTSESDQSYLDHEIKALKDIKRGCVAVINGELPFASLVQTLYLPGSVAISRNHDQWTLQTQGSDPVRLEGTDAALAESLLKKRTIKEGPFSGHESLADQISTHVLVWRGVVALSAARSNTSDERQDMERMNDWLREVALSCELTRSMDRPYKAYVLHDDDHAYPFRIEAESCEYGDISWARYSQDAEGLWFKGEYTTRTFPVDGAIQSKSAPGSLLQSVNPMNKELAMLADEVLVSHGHEPQNATAELIVDHEEPESGLSF